MVCVVGTSRRIEAYLQGVCPLECPPSLLCPPIDSGILAPLIFTEIYNTSLPFDPEENGAQSKGLFARDYPGPI